MTEASPFLSESELLKKKVASLQQQLDAANKLCSWQQGELFRLRAIEVAYSNLKTFKVRFLERMQHFIENEPFPPTN